MTGVLIADEQGLGKTVQALTVCENACLFPVIVVCPSSVRVNWQREIIKWLPHRSSTVIYGTDYTQPLPAVDVLIFGWDTIFAWFPTMPVPEALILDEAHFAKNGLARRTQAVIRFADRCHTANKLVIAMTGTPVLNRASELLPLLRIIGRLDEFGGARRFRAECQNPKRLLAINRQLRASCFLRRRKEDVLKDLPPKRHVTVALETDDILMSRYRDAERSIVSFVVKGLEGKAKPAKALQTMAAEQLVAINALRRLAVEAKLGSVIAWLDDFKATGEKAVLFAWHRQTVEMLAERYCNGKKIYGGMIDSDKQDAIDTFQNDPNQQFLACSIRAAGVGINLTAASNVVFVEQGWNHAEMDQAADRCHRIGQQGSVTAWTLNASNTIDEDITDLIRVKRLESDLVVDGDLVTNKGTTLNGELLTKMIERNHD